MANTTRGRVWREFLLVALVAAFIVPWGAATANMSAQLENDVYGWEPLGQIAGSSELRAHSLGEDVWEVWVCDTAAGSVAVEPADFRNYAVQAFMRSPSHPLELVSSFRLFEVPPVMRDSA